MDATSSPNQFRVLISGKEKLLVRLIGPITELADFGPVKFATLKPVEIDLEEITAMNSIGIREFAAWTSSLQNAVIEFSHCPKFFVDQVNMIRGLIPARSKIVSFYVPYFNPQTEEEKRILYRRGLEYDGVGAEAKLNSPDVTGSDGKPMELDVIPEKYFQFLKQYT